MTAAPPRDPHASPEARRHGRYDTPAPLARLVARLGLDRALDHAADAPDPEASLLALRVCDPSCGEGNLLVEAAARIASRLARARNASPAASLHRACLEDVVSSCLRGVERDAAVAARCRRALADLAGFTAIPTSLEAHICCDDAALIACERRWPEVFADVLARGGFDAVLGNPPFLNAIERRAATDTRRALRALHPELGATADVAFHFLAIADSLRASHGRVAMVLPRTALSAPSAKGLRARLTASLRAVYAPDAPRLFEGAHVYVCVVATGEGAGCLASHDADSDRATWRSVTVRDDAWWAAIHGALGGESDARQRLCERFEVTASMTTSEAYSLVDALCDERDGAGLALVTTGLIDRDACRWGERPCRYLGRTLECPRVDATKALTASLGRRVARARRPKVLVAGLGRAIECFVDERGEYLGAVSTWTITHPRDDVSALRALAARLHSEEVGERLRAELGATALGGGSITLTRRFLDAVPLQ